MKIRPCLLGTLAVLAACAGSRSRGAWDAPPRETPGANQADQRDEATPDTTSGGTVVESLDAWPKSAPTQSETPAIAPTEPTEPSVAVAEPPPTGTRTEEPDSPAPIRTPDKEVSLHPDAPVPDLVTLLEMQLDAAPVDRTSKGWRTRVPPPPDVPLETRRNYFWLLETDVGPLNIRLFPKTAPRHVLSVAWLTQLGFYDGLPFHRILSGAIAQSGDPVGDGSGGPGYRLDGEFPAKGPSFDREGLIGFANAGPNSDGSQFFITFGPLPHLDGKHTIVGETVGNSRPLRALMSLATKSGRPREPVKIKRAEIVIR